MLTPPAQPPTGFQGVLTRDRWRGVIDFASAINAEIVSSFVIGDGVRDESGQWSPEQAQRWLEFTPVGGARDLIASMWRRRSTWPYDSAASYDLGKITATMFLKSIDAAVITDTLYPLCVDELPLMTRSTRNPLFVPRASTSPTRWSRRVPIR